MKKNGFTEYKKLFEHLVRTVNSIDQKLDKVVIDVVKLKERDRIISKVLWCLLGGGITIAVTVVVRFL